MNTTISTQNVYKYGIVSGVLYYTTTQKVFIAIAMTIVSILTIFGNVIIIFVYIKVKSLQIARNLLLLSLSSADIVVGLISINLYTAYILLSYWPFGWFLCYFWQIIDHWSFTISNLTLVAIAFDRCLSIRFPIRHRVLSSKTYVKRVIIVIWIIAFLIWSPAILLYPYLSGKNSISSNQCLIQFYFISPYLTVTVAIVSYVVPVLLMALSYAYIHSYLSNRQSSVVVSFENKVHCNILLRNRKLDNDTNIINASVIKNLNIEKDTKENCRNTQNFNKFVVTSKVNEKPCNISNANNMSVKQHQLTLHTKIKSSRSGKRLLTLLLVMLVFIISWMSYHIMIVIVSVYHTVLSEHLWRFCHIIGWMNSTINPCCYALFNNKFRRGFKRVLHCTTNEREIRRLRVGQR